MFGIVEHLGFSLLLIITGMVTANPGLCPFYPKVHERAKYCYIEEECKRDFDCQSHEKCCENPCGIKICTDNIIPDPLDKIEKCYKDPNIIESSECRYKQTKFCFIKDCKRCCVHSTSCNPSPKLVTHPRNCHSEICGDYSCPQQGSICHVDELTNSPICKCKTYCKRSGGYVCASYNNVPQTFRNRCYMEKHACEMKKTFQIEYEGRCKPPPKKVLPLERPTIRDPIHTLSLKSRLLVDCYGDRELVRLRWLQRRVDGTDVEVVGIESERGLYEIDGRLRKVLRLKIPSIGPGSYGRYVCRQTYDHTTMERELQVNPIYEAAFDQSTCQLPVDSGTCTAQLPNFFYNHASKRCEEFNYTGCDGNANNFQTLDDCRIKCEGELSQDHRKPRTLCDLKECPPYAKCYIHPFTGAPYCHCENTCTFSPEIICASDRKHYLNECLMKYNSCKQNRKLTVLKQGLCLFIRSLI